MTFYLFFCKLGRLPLLFNLFLNLFSSEQLQKTISYIDFLWRKLALTHPSRDGFKRQIFLPEFKSSATRVKVRLCAT